MTLIIRSTVLGAALSVLCTPFAPALAKLPDPVRAMVDAAIETGDETKVAAVAEMAKITNPGDTAEVDAMLIAFTASQERRAAQLAAEELAEIRRAGVFDNWSGEGQIGAFQSSGNSTSVGITAALRLKRKGIKWSHLLRAGADYQRNNGITTREQFLFAYEPRYQLNDRLFAYGLAQYERDRFQGYSSRYAASSGLGYKVIDTETMNLAVKAGPAWRKTDFINGNSDSRLAGLAGADFEWQIADNIALTQDLVTIIDTNTSLVSNTGLEAGISDALTARLSYTVEYDSKPPTGAVSTDTLSRFTLIYGF